MKTMIFGLFLLLAWRSGVDAQTPFYQGKSSILPGLYFDQLVGRSEVQFDYAKFSWIGSTDRSNNLVIVRADSPYKSIRDVRGASQAPSARRREPARSLIKFPGSWKKPSALNLIL